MNPILFFVTKITPSAGAPVVDTVATEAPGLSQKLMSNPIGVIVLYCVVLFVVMYFFSVRPTKKREQKLADLRSAIDVGDAVMLNNGMFGTVTDITVECFIIEFGTNKGVRIPVVKQEVFGKREPNLSNKLEEKPVSDTPKKKGLFGFGK